MGDPDHNFAQPLPEFSDSWVRRQVLRAKLRTQYTRHTDPVCFFLDECFFDRPCSQKRILSRQAVEDWFKEYKALLDKHRFHPGLIFNCDETMLKTIKQKVKVITRQHDPQPFTPFPDQEPEHITVLSCIAADGSHLKPLLIFPLKTTPARSQGRFSHQWTIFWLDDFGCLHDLY